jgi:molybdenum cofactor cytidylyltransferase
VYVAAPGDDDVGEDQAALRIAEAVHGPGLRVPGAAAGRANLLATSLGLLRVDGARLVRVNEVDGVTLATLKGASVVRPGQLAATLKVIPYAVPEARVRAAEAAAREGGPLLRVDALPARRVGLLLCAAPAARDRVTAAFDPTLRARVEALGSSLREARHLSLEDERGELALAEALREEAGTGAGLILIAGETAIVDRHDIAPRAIARAGGRVEAFGVPVDPGNLLLLAYLGAVPVLCAPGCARSPRHNVVDVVMPRLLAGDVVTRAELLALGEGGLLEDVPERPMPREQEGGPDA